MCDCHCYNGKNGTKLAPLLLNTYATLDHRYDMLFSFLIHNLSSYLLHLFPRFLGSPSISLFLSISLCYGRAFIQAGRVLL